VKTVLATLEVLWDARMNDERQRPLAELDWSELIELVDQRQPEGGNGVELTEAAWREFARRVYSIASRTLSQFPDLDKDDREDIYQCALADMATASVWQQVKAARQHVGFFHTLFGRRALNHIRSAKRRLQKHEGYRIDLESAPEVQEEEPERGELLRAAIKRLPPGERSAIELLLEDLGNREIATRLGITPSAAAARICRGLNRLRRLLRGPQS
jgi:RNA polymerase sigma factor (sigma-70 family)